MPSPISEGGVAEAITTFGEREQVGCLWNLLPRLLLLAPFSESSPPRPSRGPSMASHVARCLQLFYEGQWSDLLCEAGRRIDAN